jgi:hypothetical protein
MIGDITQREDELGGKTLLIVGLGQIGGRGLLGWANLINSLTVTRRLTGY